MGARTTLCSLSLLALFAVWVGDARAQKPAELPRPERIEHARALFESGVAHFNLGEYDAAVADFESGYRYRPEPLFLYNIAQAHRRANHREPALAYYRRYLELVPDAPERAAVLATIEVLSRPPTPPPEPAPPRPAPEPAPPRPPPPAPRARLIAALALGAGALALTGAGLGLQLSADDSYQTLQRTCAPSCDRASWAWLPARYYAADALFAAAAGVAVVDVILWAIELRARRMHRHFAGTPTLAASR